MACDFGLVCSLGAATEEGAKTLPEENRAFLRALRAPFTTFWMEDHFQFGERPLLECWTALCTYGAEFPRLRMGTIVLGQSYRNPAMTAKMAAALQWMSGGRLIYGIGAGWKEDEYKAYGYPFPSAAVRIRQLEEAVIIAKKMWSGFPASYEGKDYAIHDAISSPLPDPVPPILIGGGGEQLTLRVVARHADWWNIGFRTAEQYQQKVDVLKQHCRDVGRDFNTIKLTYYARVNVVEKAEEFQPNERMHVIGGTAEQVANELQQFVDLGVEHIMVGFNDFPSQRGLELFQNDVVPRLRLS